MAGWRQKKVKLVVQTCEAASQAGERKEAGFYTRRTSDGKSVLLHM